MLRATVRVSEQASCACDSNDVNDRNLRLHMPSLLRPAHLQLCMQTVRRNAGLFWSQAVDTLRLCDLTDFDLVTVNESDILICQRPVILVTPQNASWLH